MGNDWNRLAVVVGGAAAAGMLLWYLLRDESPSEKRLAASKPSERQKSVGEMDKQDVLRILQEIVESQSDMSALMKEVTEVVLKEELSFQQVYARVKERQPQDPLEKRGLSIQDFDTLLDTHQNDDDVKAKIGEIMTAGNVKPPSNAKPVPVSEIIAVHEFMCNELKELVAEYKQWDNKDAYEKKTLTIAAQAMVASRVQKSYAYTSEQIEACVLANHNALSTDARFTALSVQMQQTMGLLLG